MDDTQFNPAVFNPWVSDIQYVGLSKYKNYTVIKNDIGVICSSQTMAWEKMQKICI